MSVDIVSCLSKDDACRSLESRSVACHRAHAYPYP